MRRVSLADLDAPPALPSDPSARVALVWEVTLDAWASSELAMPEYERGDAPGVLVRRRDGAR